MRRPIIAANFKMHMSAADTAAYAAALCPAVGGVEDVDIVVAPPFTALDRAAQAFRGSSVRLAAQNVNAEAAGAFTGEISLAMLVGAGLRVRDRGPQRAPQALRRDRRSGRAPRPRPCLPAGLRPIVCVGETLAEREAGRTLEVVERPAPEEPGLGVPATGRSQVVVAYEPVWAIGTGRTATPELAQEVHRAVRRRLVEVYGDAGRAMRIQYGGSVKPDNAGELMAQPDIDGALVGGASLDPAGFAGIVGPPRTDETRAALSRRWRPSVRRPRCIRSSSSCTSWSASF